MVLLTLVLCNTFCPIRPPLRFSLGWSLLLLFDTLSAPYLFIYLGLCHRETVAFYCSSQCGTDKSSENSQLQSSFTCCSVPFFDRYHSLVLSFVFCCRDSQCSIPRGVNRPGLNPVRRQLACCVTLGCGGLECTMTIMVPSSLLSHHYLITDKSIFSSKDQTVSRPQGFFPAFRGACTKLDSDIALVYFTLIFCVKYLQCFCSRVK